MILVWILLPHLLSVSTVTPPRTLNSGITVVSVKPTMITMMMDFVRSVVSYCVIVALLLILPRHVINV